MQSRHCSHPSPTAPRAPERAPAHGEADIQLLPALQQRLGGRCSSTQIPSSLSFGDVQCTLMCPATSYRPMGLLPLGSSCRPSSTSAEQQVRAPVPATTETLALHPSEYEGFPTPDKELLQGGARVRASYTCTRVFWFRLQEQILCRGPLDRTAQSQAWLNPYSDQPQELHPVQQEACRGIAPPQDCWHSPARRGLRG